MLKRALLILLVMGIVCPAWAASPEERTGRITVGTGIGFAAGGGQTGFDYGIRASYHILPYLAAGLIFDLLATGSNIAGVVGPRIKGTFNLPEVTDKLELTGGMTVGYFMFEGAGGEYDDDVIIQPMLGAGYEIIPNLILGTEMGFNFAVNLGEFVFNWLPAMVFYRF